VLGGISPIDPSFICNLAAQGVLDMVDAVAVHGFPLDWNHWQIHEWPERIAEIQAVTSLPVWVTEVGVSTFGAEEVQEFGLRSDGRTAGRPRAPRIHWYSLYDLPKAWPATTRHREAEGSSYYRHFHMGLLREDGTPKLACARVRRLHARVRHLPVVPFRGPPARRRRALAEASWAFASCAPACRWADSFRPDADAWFDRQMAALEDFDVTITFCFTPEHRGLQPHHTSAPQVPQEFADFCARMVRRYAPAQGAAATAAAPTPLAAVV
jgi:beta-xylosidase